MSGEPEFYIGWEAKASRANGVFLRRVILLLVCGALASGLLLAFLQRTIGVSVFEWGKLRDFSGTLVGSPYPQLIVRRPGEPLAVSSYYLVKPLKFGLDAELVRKFDGKDVTMKGTLIYRENQVMIEVVQETVKLAESGTNGAPIAPAVVKLGVKTLVGEIVDSKCFLGVMNPGRYQAHRGCAIRCISGGCPPLFVTQKPNGENGDYYLLVSTDGAAVNKEVLDMVAEPLEITGQAERQGGLLLLKADPKGYKRVR